MGKYILKRLLILLPTLLAIMVISFMVSRNTPGDPVKEEIRESDGPGSVISREDYDSQYRDVSHRLGLDRPLFYFSVRSMAMPDTLYRILRRDRREALAQLIDTYGNWDEISAFHYAVQATEAEAYAIRPSAESKADVDDVKLALQELLRSPTKEEIMYRLDLIDSLSIKHPAYLAGIGRQNRDIRQKFDAVESEATTWKLYVPTFVWYGWENQFNHWLGRMFQLDFGKSYRDRLPVKRKIADALPWTIFMGLFSFILAYLIAIPVGVYSVRKRNSWQDQTVTTLLFLLYSVPTFVMGMILMGFLCNPEFLYWFPTSGVTSDGAENWSWFARMKDYAYHLILPTLVYSYGSVAFLSRQMRVGMLDTISSDYIRTARAKGLSEGVVIWKHAFRNSILPLVTHFGTLLPRLIAGAIIVEKIFSIPGMGRLTIQATMSQDHPTIIVIFTLGGILSLLGILVSDILYALVDPRISYNKS